MALAYDPILIIKQAAEGMTESQFREWVAGRAPAPEMRLINEDTGAVFSYKADANGVLKKSKVQP